MEKGGLASPFEIWDILWLHDMFQVESRDLCKPTSSKQAMALSVLPRSPLTRACSLRFSEENKLVLYYRLFNPVRTPLLSHPSFEHPPLLVLPRCPA